MSFIYGEERAKGLIKYNVPDHYRQVFKKFAQGKKFVWNWAAGFFPEFWFLYRRMPHWYIPIALPIGLFIPIIPGLLADRLLIKYIAKQTRKGDFEGLPKGGARGTVIAGFFATIPIFMALAEMGKKKSDDEYVQILLILGFSSVILIQLIAIIYKKYKVWAYKNNNKS